MAFGAAFAPLFQPACLSMFTGYRWTTFLVDGYFMYAIFRAAGKQFKAEKGKTLRLPLMSAEAGSKITFDEVLLSSDGQTVKAGAPLVKGAKVLAEVVRDGKEPKIYVFKFKRRKNYRRKTGHRQKYTEVRVTDVQLG
jgi:large subunit ribosomal protein L21